MHDLLPVTAGTHPDIASLVDPLFASRKEGQLQLNDIAPRDEIFQPRSQACAKGACKLRVTPCSPERLFNRRHSTKKGIHTSRKDSLINY